GQSARDSSSPYQTGPPAASAPLAGSSANPAGTRVRSMTSDPPSPASAMRSATVARVGTSRRLAPRPRSTGAQSRTPASSMTTWPVAGPAPTQTHWAGTATAAVRMSEESPSSRARSRPGAGCSGWPRCTTAARPSMLATVASVSAVVPRSSSSTGSFQPAVRAASIACAGDSRSLRPSMSATYRRPGVRAASPVADHGVVRAIGVVERVLLDHLAVVQHLAGDGHGEAVLTTRVGLAVGRGVVDRLLRHDVALRARALLHRVVLGAPDPHREVAVRHEGLHDRAVRRVVAELHVLGAHVDRGLAPCGVAREPVGVRVVLDVVEPGEEACVERRRRHLRQAAAHR